MRALIIAYLVAPGFVALGLLAYLAAHADAPDCITDTECMAYCPPHADDPDCDGGPQS